MKLSRVVGGVGLAAGAVGVVAARDLMQKRHALMRNYPVIAHARYWLETIGPELRQYIVTGNDEERPFSRDQRSWIYASSKQENNYSGFGTDNDVEHLPGYAIIKHRTFAALAAARPRGEGRAASSQGRRWSAGPGEGVPSRLADQHLGDELRLDVGQRHRGAQQGREAGRLHAQHRRGRALPAPPPGRRHRAADRYGVLRLPRPGRQLLAEQAQGGRRLRAGARDRDQALPGRQARARVACCPPPR